MGTVVLDSSVILGVLDPKDVHHQAATRAVREHRRANAEFLVPASALAEVLVGASRLGSEAVQATEGFVDRIASEVVPIDREVARAAAGLRARHRSLRLPDALVLGCAAVRRADIVLTDRSWRRVDSRVVLIDIPESQPPKR